MYDPFISAINTQKAALGWFDSISTNLANVYTPGYRQHKTVFSDFLNGAQLFEVPRDVEQGKAMPGRAPTNLMVEGSGYFVVRKTDGSLLFTRLGDFNFEPNGSLVNGKNYKVQGYLLGEDEQGD